MTIGIYRIRNIINNKAYVGKSKNLENRKMAHFRIFRRGEIFRGCNRHLMASVLKHGIENFVFEVLETFEELDPDKLADAEVKWMDELRTLERDFGYNLMRDSSSDVIVSEETKRILSERNSGEGNGNYGNKWTPVQKKRMSEIKKQQFADGVYDFMQDPEHKAYIANCTREMWKDEEKKASMARKVAVATSSLRFEQYDKHTKELVGEYDNLLQIMDKYPDFHKIAIYSVCNGWKKSYRGFIWKSIAKDSK